MIPFQRVCNKEVARMFFCRVCGQFPRHAKVSKMCLHLYCSVCIHNFKMAVKTSKCPPDHKDDENDDLCIIPSTANDKVYDRDSISKPVREKNSQELTDFCTLTFRHPATRV